MNHDNVHFWTVPSSLFISEEFMYEISLCLIFYVQHTAVGGSKSYICPVCGRALSSPGSLGRHLLIHSEDRLSNCAVCGARFTDTNNFNRSALYSRHDFTRMLFFIVVSNGFLV